MIKPILQQQLELQQQLDVSRKIAESWRKAPYFKITDVLISTWVFLGINVLWNTIRLYIKMPNKSIQLIFSFAAPTVTLGLQICWIISIIILMHRIKNVKQFKFVRPNLINYLLEIAICFGISISTYTLIEIVINVVNRMDLLPPTMSVLTMNNVITRIFDIFHYAIASFLIVVTYYVCQTAKLNHLKRYRSKKSKI